MKNTFCFVLTLTGLFFSISVLSQGSGSTQTENSGQELQQLPTNTFEQNSPLTFGENIPGENKSFEITRTVKGNLVKVEKGLFSLKTTKGELLNLKITPKTKIKSKKDSKDLSNGKLVKVTYLPETLLKKELEAVRIKILN